MVVDQRTLMANKLRSKIGANVTNKLTGQQAQTTTQQTTPTIQQQPVQQQPEVYKVITNKFPTYDIKDMMGAGSMKNQISFMQSVGNYNRLKAQADANTDPNVRYNLTKPQLTNKQTLQIEQATPETNEQGLKINKTNSFKDLVIDLQNVANQGRNLEFMKFRELYPEYVENWDRVVDLFESIKSNPQYSAEQVTTTAQKAYPELFGIKDNLSDKDKTTALKKLYDEMVSNKQNGIQLTQQDIIDRYPEYANTEDINTVMEVQNLMNRDRKNTPTFNDIYENFESLTKGDVEVGNTEKEQIKKDLANLDKLEARQYNYLSDEGKEYVKLLGTAKAITDELKKNYWIPNDVSERDVLQEVKNKYPDIYSQLTNGVSENVQVSDKDRKLLDGGSTAKSAGKYFKGNLLEFIINTEAGLGDLISTLGNANADFYRDLATALGHGDEWNDEKFREGSTLLGDTLTRAAGWQKEDLENAQRYKEFQEENQKTFKQAMKDGDWTTMIGKSVGLIGQTLPALITSAASGGATGVGFATFLPSSYERALEDLEADESIKLTDNQKRGVALLMGSVESAIEEMSLNMMFPGLKAEGGLAGQVLNKIPGMKNALLRFAVQTELGAASESMEEVAQEFSNNLIARAAGSNRDMGEFSDYWDIFTETFLSSQLISALGGAGEGINQAKINQIQKQITEQADLRNKVLEGQAIMANDFNEFANAVEVVPGTTTEELQQVWNNTQQKKQELEEKANRITSNSYSNVATPTYQRATVKDTVNPKITANESQQYTDLLDEMIKNKEISEEDRKRVEKTLGVFTLNNKSLVQQQGEKQLESQQPTGLSNLTDKTENNNTNNNRKIKAGVGTRMLQNYNRMNPKRVRKFEAQFGKTYGQWMEERGFTKAGESNVNDIMDYSKQMQKIKTDIIKKIAGDYRNIAVSDMLSYANERATDTLDRENIEWLQPLLDKYLAGKGLTFQEIEKMRKYFSNNINLPYYEDTDAKTAQKNMNIYTALQKYVEKIAAENGFDKLKEINAEISASEAIARGVIEKILGGDVNNTLGLTDWITIASAVSAGSPGAIATVLTKNALKNEKVRNAILKIAVGKRDNAKYRGVKVDLDNISKIADEKRRQQAIKEFNEKYGDLGIALPYKEGYNGTPTTTITVTPEGLSKTQGNVNTPNSEQKSQGLSETQKNSETENNTNEEVQGMAKINQNDNSIVNQKREIMNDPNMDNNKKAKRLAGNLGAIKRNYPSLFNEIMKWYKDNGYDVDTFDGRIFNEDEYDNAEGDNLYNYSDIVANEGGNNIVMNSPLIMKDGEIVSRGKYSIGKENVEVQDSIQDFLVGVGANETKQDLGNITTADYKNMSRRGLEQLLESDKIPAEEAKKITEELDGRKVKEESNEEGWGYLDHYYAYKINQLQEEEQRIGKVGNKKVNKTYAEEQMKTWETKKEKLKEDMKQAYGDKDNDRVEDKYSELEGKSIDYINEWKKSKRFAVDEAEQQVIAKLQENWNKIKRFELNMTEEEKKVREDILGKVSDLYETKSTDYGDSFVSRANRDNRGIIYRDDGRVNVNSLDTLKSSGLYDVLPDDTKITISGQEQTTLGELKKQPQGLAEVNQTKEQPNAEGLSDMTRQQKVEPKSKFVDFNDVDMSSKHESFGTDASDNSKQKNPNSAAGVTYYTASKMSDLDGLLRRYGGKGVNSTDFVASYTLGELLDNPALYKKYPGLENKLVIFADFHTNKKRGVNFMDTIYINSKIYEKNPGLARSTIVHEIEHEIQKYEGTYVEKSEAYQNSNRLGEDYVNDPNEQGARKKQQEYLDFIGQGNTKFQKGKGNPITKKQVNQLVKQLKKTGLAKDVKVYETQEEFEQAMDAENARLQSVWHGGGDFNRFDLNHVGEGEGNAAHGYGIYVTENKDRASEYGTLYRDNAYGIDTTFGRGTEQFVTYKGKKINEIDGENSSLIRKIVDGMQTKNEAYPYYDAESQIARIRRSINSEQNTWLGKLSANEFAAMKKRNQEKLDFLDSLDPNDFKVENTKRNLYDVEVPDTVKKDTPTGTNYLEEDGMITHEAYTEINDKLSEKIGEKLTRWSNKVTGKVLYERLAEKLGSMKAASEFLKDLGYDGIHYIGELDGSSYVIFDDKALQINDHIKYLKDTHGDIAGAVTPDGTVHLIESNLRGDTATHEFSHLLWSYAKKNNPNLYKALQKIAREAPQELKDYVKRTYGEMTDEAFLDEVFAWKQGKYSGIKTARTWYQRMWDAIKNIWNSIKNSFGSKYADLDVFEAYETMSSEELMDRVDKLLKGGKEIGKGNGNANYEISNNAVDSQGKKLTPEQQMYFANSKVRDNNGNLLRVYHGTTAGDFTIYQQGKGDVSNTLAKVGYWFTPSQEGAKSFAEQSHRGDADSVRVEEVYLNIQNPKIYDPRDINLLDEDTREKKINEQWNIYLEKKKQANGLDYTVPGGMFGDEFDHNYNERAIFDNLRRSYENDKLYEGKLGKYNAEEFRKLAEFYNEQGANIDYDKILKDFEEYERLKEDAEVEHAKYQDMARNDPYEDFQYDIYKVDRNMDNRWTKKDIGMALNDYNSPIKYVEQLKAEGYDGIIIKGTDYDSNVFGGKNDQYVVFDSNQIKRITNDNPTSNPDVRYEKIGGLSNMQVRKFAVQQGLAEIAKPQTKEYVVKNGKVGLSNMSIRFQRTPGNISDLDPNLSSKVGLNYQISSASDPVIHGLLDYLLNKKGISGYSDGMASKFYYLNKNLPKRKYGDNIKNKSQIDQLGYDVKDMIIYWQVHKNRKYIKDMGDGATTYAEIKLGGKTLQPHMSESLYNKLKAEGFIIDKNRYSMLIRKGQKIKP